MLVVIYYWVNKFFLEERIKFDPTFVVNIYCESDYGEYSSGGSGTIWSEDGLIITNAHIIPENDITGEIDANSTCTVTLPDPTSGQPEEIYWASPIVVPGISEYYDIAFIQIDDVFYDIEADTYYGDYPRKFPHYVNSRKCNKKNITLGSPVVVYGYPAISGGYALTVTDGIISSLLPEEGLIVTSAKISHGNSGGIAIDENGCMLGIPTYFYGDEGESLGILVSNVLIEDFMDELYAYIELIKY